jgi:hypothetical protein
LVVAQARRVDLTLTTAPVRAKQRSG